MTRQVLQILFVFSLILLLNSCAQIVPLSGGARDVTPPKIVESIPEHSATNFTTNLVTIRFDEFIQLKDLNNQLIVTPKLKTNPEITVDGKKVLIKFEKQELAPNTTYRLAFGKAIADVNESNSIPDFEYVFSTGNFIDTLKLKGEISNSTNNKAVGGVLVALYNTSILSDSLSNDSLIYKIEPDYWTRSLDNGSFIIKNLPHTSFVGYAFTDKNKNNLYDGETERVAFLNETLKLEHDSVMRLKLFQEPPFKSYIKKTSQPYLGFSQIILNKKSLIQLNTLNAEESQNISETNIGKEKDTVSFYYRNVSDSLDIRFSNLSSGKTDTLKLTLPKPNRNKKRFNPFSLNTIGNKLPLNTNLKLSFLTWMDTSKFDLSKIKISSKEDALTELARTKGRWLDITTFEIEHPIKEGINYTIKIDTNSFFDHNQVSNDSAIVHFTTQSKNELGKVTLKVLFNTKQNYVVQLINEQEKVFKEKVVSLSLSSSNATTLEFTDVMPGVYFTKIIFDDNKNAKWDTGNLLLKQQPEKVIINSKQLKVVSDWEIEEEILIKD